VPGERVIDVGRTGIERRDERKIPGDKALDELLRLLGQTVRVDDCGSFQGESSGLGWFAGRRC
jgi:hypothetical protein